jgi:DNA-binding IclR family transcriptional regulator
MKRTGQKVRDIRRTEDMPTGRESDFLRVFERLEKGLLAQGIEQAPTLREIAEELGVNIQRACALAQSLIAKGRLTSDPRRHRSYSLVR